MSPEAISLDLSLSLRCTNKQRTQSPRVEGTRGVSTVVAKVLTVVGGESDPWLTFPLR